jgi:hypothetical protein
MIALVRPTAKDVAALTPAPCKKPQGAGHPLVRLGERVSGSHFLKSARSGAPPVGSLEIKRKIKGKIRNKIKGKIRNKIKGKIKNKIKGKIKNKIKGKIKDKTKGKIKNKIKGSGQECPLHTEG